MKPPFRLPISRQRDQSGPVGPTDTWSLVDADMELICSCEAATTTELEYIVNAVNEYGRLSQFAADHPEKDL